MSTVLGMLSGLPRPSEQVRRALQRAQEARATLILEPPTTSMSIPIAMEATIEQVRAADLVINQPVYEGLVRQLVKGEGLRMSFSVEELGHVAGETRVLGRCKAASGGDTPLYGYRLAIPQRLRKLDRRSSARTTVDSDLAREVELYPLDADIPIRGTIYNVSVGGMQIRTHDSKQRLQRGQRVRLVAFLPPPVGEVNRMVTIVRLGSDRSPMQRVVGVQFERKLPGLAELIEEQTSRRAYRQAG
jgi:c-di-GMP-binding flagellar brake protein YcgR